MINEKELQRKSSRYAAGVVKALTSATGPRSVMWSEVVGLLEAAYFNAFQSGVVWQKKVREHEDERPFRIDVTPVDLYNGRFSNMTTAVTKEGLFIGSVKEATTLWKKFGITKFELRTRRSKVCSVGYSPSKALWFGWSHRAIRGFKTRREASKFAESVS